MTQPHPLPPLEALRAAFAYSPETGALTWRETGAPAGCQNGQGYIRVQLGGRHLKAHRVAWALYNGADPGQLLVDHINRDRSDNRAANLRLVDPRGNRANSGQGAPTPTPKRPVQVEYPGGEVRRFPSVRAAARFLGRDPKTVYRYARGLCQPPNGLTVAYAPV
jgi:hypothetical protein